MAAETTQPPLEALQDRAKSPDFAKQVQEAAAALGAVAQPETSIDAAITDTNAVAVENGMAGNNTLGTTEEVKNVAAQAVAPTGSEWTFSSPNQEFPVASEPANEVPGTSQPVDALGSLETNANDSNFLKEVQNASAGAVAQPETSIDAAITDTNAAAVENGLDGKTVPGTTPGVKDLAGQAMPTEGSKWTL